ncbi:alpha/beta hydrolase [Paracoccus albus]|uniref:alpha/beta hydrolase n=1 Tax=Paracoccus albus TaxID=3017784 RepID=UPI0022F04F2B|nr:alpha/beta hydrolase [Paracoccus albus]WBU61685.1 alpha/beta hydrolase [Paracoccus albus]
MNYRGFTAEELEREYQPSSMIGGNFGPYLAAYDALSREVRENHSVQESLSYGASSAHVLDYFPAAGSGAPLHVFIHGGYWQALSQRQSAGMAPGLLAAGQAFATLNYTLAPKARLGDMIAECRDALIWLAGQAAELGFDPARMTLSGHSAGAHLVASLLGLEGAALSEAGITVTDAILISGVFDLEPISLMTVNDPLQLTEGEIETLSPLNMVPLRGPRYRVTVGERDTAEFVRQSRSYAEHLRKAGVEVSFDLQHGKHHYDIIMHDPTFLPGS